MKTSIVSALAVLLGLLVWAAVPASAKTKDPCKKAEIKLAKTGQGDLDLDGLSDCREAKILRTLVDDPDTDDDALDDGEEMEESCDPHDPDTDDDGIEDGDDPSPAVEQEVEALLDALTCPVNGTPGSITALGITATLDADTRFSCKSCEELAALLVPGEDVFVEIEILEDVLGALTATEVELKRRHHDDCDDDHDDDDDDDEDEDDDDEDDDEDEDDD